MLPPLQISATFAATPRAHWQSRFNSDCVGKYQSLLEPPVYARAAPAA
ncbi:MAG: hypothetical protein NTY85_02415 [Actinobacteria bacterium]|nr:hypothetical protein [Actinomycetota bacterium]